MTRFKFVDDYRLAFEIWAPRLKSLELFSKSDDSLQTLSRSSDGVFAGTVIAQKFPFQYSFRLDGGGDLPDPFAIYLPDGVHGSCEISYEPYEWNDLSWQGIPTEELIIYELHVGTFTGEGTLDACRQQLDYLVDLGVNAIELMPLAQCPGRWNWGYDGVGLFAMNHNYGTPNGLKRLVDECHSRKISVVLDVVYNHVGPEGNYLGEYGNYFSKKHGTPWGSAFDFDGPNKKHARNFVIENALFWLSEYHLDGLRLDAIHYMFDNSEYSIQQEICDRVRALERETNRRIHLIGEANIYEHELVEPDTERNTYSAIWADDILHSIYSIANANVELTPREYEQASDLAEALNFGYIFTGPELARANANSRAQTHGSDFETQRNYLSSLIIALQTHDSVGNHPQGKRLHQIASTEFQLAAIPLIMLYPAIPMIFMGEEFASETPFMFFADFIDDRLRKAVDRGRKKEFPNHDWTHSVQPSDERAFFDCKLKLPDSDNVVLTWYKNLIQLRKMWRANGWLDAEHFSSCCDQQRKLFSFRFNAGETNVFIVSRLCPAEADIENIEISVNNAKIVLDSCNPTQFAPEVANLKSEQTIELANNQSIVGYGTICT